MGGVESTQQEINSAATKKRLQSDWRDDALQLKESGSVTNRNSGRCFNCLGRVTFCVPAKEKNNTADKLWKMHLMNEFKQLKDSEWAKILLKLVKSWNNDTGDHMLQAQIHWIDLGNARGLSKPSFTQNVNENLSMSSEREEEALISKQGMEAQLIDGNVSKLLEKTDILEKNLFASLHESALLKRLMKSEAYSNSHGDSFLMNPEEIEGSERFSSNPASIDSYKHNTFLNGAAAIIEGKDQSFQLMQIIQNYKLITELIESHLQSSSSVFYQMIKKFSSYFTDKYKKTIVSQSANLISKADLCIQVTSAVNDLQQFIRLMYEGINLFYKLESINMGERSLKEAIFNRDNLINFVTSLILTESLYLQIFELLRMNDLETEEAIERKFAICSKKPPEFFGIPPEYCLNTKTLHFYFGSENAAFMSFSPQQEQKKPVPRRRYPLDQQVIGAKGTSLEMSQLFYGNLGEHSLGWSRGGKIEGPKDPVTVAKNAFREPFKRCIKTLRRIERQQSPIHKLKTIIKTAELINSEIVKFYKAFKIKRSVTLDADQTLSIFIFIVARAEVKDLMTHIRLIEKLATSNVMNSISGYYLTTLEACMNCLINMEMVNEKKKDSFKDFCNRFKDYFSSIRKDPKSPYRTVGEQMLAHCDSLEGYSKEVLVPRAVI